MKRCPRCEGRLADVQVGAVRVDGCADCGGVWFNNTELGTIASTDASDLLALEDQFLPGPSSHSMQKTLLCPDCQVGMYEFAFPHVPNVRLDACPSCKGIWADDGELHAIYSAMARAGAVPQSPDPRRTARQALDVFSAHRCSGCGTVNTASSLQCRSCGITLAPHDKELCPNCDVVLYHRDFGTLVLETCNDCTGVWLDAGELSVLTHFRPEELQQFQEAAAQNRSGASVLWKPNPTLLCPRCCVGMVTQERTHATGVGLDQCERCNGIWVSAELLPTVSRHYTESLTRRKPLA